MKISGVEIRELLRILENKRPGLIQIFKESQWKFKNENSEDPLDISEALFKIGTTLAKVQAAQDFYNIKNMVSFKIDNRETITLSEAIKLLGVYDRQRDLWYQTVVKKDKDVYLYESRRPVSLEEGAQLPERTVSQTNALVFSASADKRASELRALIGVANNIEIEIEWLTVEDFNIV